MTANIISEVNKYLKTKIDLYSEAIYIDMFPSDGTEEIMARNDPSSFKVIRYLDKARGGVFNYAYYAKSLDPQKAREQLDSILAALDLEEMTTITDVCQVKTEAITSPVFVSKTDLNEYIYTATLSLEYYKEG